MKEVVAHDWHPDLLRLNSLILNDDWGDALSSDVQSAGWCGATPALETEIQEAEQRLGVSLPPSYRSFLAVSNGWRLYNHFIERLWPVQEIDWLRLADVDSQLGPGGYDGDVLSDEEYRNYDGDHVSAIRPKYFPDCLLIGRAWPCETDLLLLNPQVTFPDQEWEAIFFAHWLPGNTRYRTFRDLFTNNIETLEMMATYRKAASTSE